MDWTKPQTVGPVLLVALAGLIPWLTWWTLTTPNPHHAVTDTPIFLAGLGFLLMLTVRIGSVDLALALFAGYTVLRVLPLTSPFAWEAASVTVFGALALVTLSRMPSQAIAWCKALLLAGGVLQVGYAAIQWGGYDPIWLGWSVPIHPDLPIRGTLGNSNYLGTYSALLLVLGPVWLMPIFLVGIGLSKSLLALAAVGIGLAVRYRQHWLGWGLVLTSAAGAVIVVAWIRGGWQSSLQHRLDVWSYALTDWLAHPVLGWGTGAWALRIPMAQATNDTISVHKEVFVQAHNEYLQVLYDEGVIGLGLLAVWLWVHRALWRGPSAGVLACLAVVCVAMFPFHVGTIGLLVMMVLGFALAEERIAYETVDESWGVVGGGAGRHSYLDGLAVGNLPRRQPTL